MILAGVEHDARYGPRMFKEEARMELDLGTIIGFIDPLVLICGRLVQHAELHVRAVATVNSHRTVTRRNCEKDVRAVGLLLPEAKASH